MGIGELIRFKQGLYCCPGRVGTSLCQPFSWLLQGCRWIALFSWLLLGRDLSNVSHHSLDGPLASDMDQT